MFDKNKQGAKKALNSSNEIVDKQEVAGRKPEGRPERIPLTQQFRLSIPTGIKEDGFVYRYIRDSAERVEGFQNAWWVPVVDGYGKPVRKASGEGYLLLYKIEEKYYNEDLAEKEKKPINLLVEQAKLRKGRNYSEYVPEGQESVVTINS